MPEYVKRPRYQIGDKLRFKTGQFLVGTVTEARGTFQPDGHVMYRVRVPMDPEPLWFLLREEDVEKV